MDTKEFRLRISKYSGKYGGTVYDYFARCRNKLLLGPFLEAAIEFGHRDLVFDRYGGYFDNNGFNAIVQGFVFQDALKPGTIMYFLGRNGNDEFIGEIRKQCGTYLEPHLDLLCAGLARNGHLDGLIRAINEYRLTRHSESMWCLESALYCAFWSPNGVQWRILKWLAQNCTIVHFRERRYSGISWRLQQAGKVTIDPIRFLLHPFREYLPGTISDIVQPTLSLGAHRILDLIDFLNLCNFTFTKQSQFDDMFEFISLHSNDQGLLTSLSERILSSRCGSGLELTFFNSLQFFIGHTSIACGWRFVLDAVRLYPDIAISERRIWEEIRRGVWFHCDKHPVKYAQELLGFITYFVDKGRINANHIWREIHFRGECEQYFAPMNLLVAKECISRGYLPPLEYFDLVHIKSCRFLNQHVELITLYMEHSHPLQIQASLTDMKREIIESCGVEVLASSHGKIPKTTP